MRFKNTNEVTMMVWETNPNKRKKGNLEVKVNVRKAFTLKIEDEIYTHLGDQISIWTVKEIINTRPSCLSDYNYVICMCNWELLKLPKTGKDIN